MFWISPKTKIIENQNIMETPGVHLSLLSRCFSETIPTKEGQKKQRETPRRKKKKEERRTCSFLSPLYSVKWKWSIPTGNREIYRGENNIGGPGVSRDLTNVTPYFDISRRYFLISTSVRSRSQIKFFYWDLRYLSVLRRPVDPISGRPNRR